MLDPEKKQRLIDEHGGRSLFLNILLYKIKSIIKQRKESVHGFSVKNWKDMRPMEDSVWYNSNTFAIADGITRDPLNMPVLLTTRNISGMIKYFWNYPETTEERSPATEAAEVFTFSFLYQLEKAQRRDENAVFNAFDMTNEYIKEMNERSNLNPDFLENDYWGCVAAGATLWGNKLSYGFIADCGLIIFDNERNIKFKTKNKGPNSKGSIDEDLEVRFGSNFQSPFGRKKIRQHYRNNPSEPLSYGALTGESRALRYVRTGTIEVEATDTLVLYTDGLEDAVTSEEFAWSLRKWKRLRSICKEKVETQGSVIVKYPLLENY